MAAKVVQCRIMPRDQDIKNGRVQVVCYLGEGSRRRSVTRFIHRQGRIWVGNNPDNRAPELNATASAAAESAYKNLDNALVYLAKLGKINEHSEAYRDQNEVVAGLKVSLRLAEENKASVEQEFPLRLEFNIIPEFEF